MCKAARPQNSRASGRLWPVVLKPTWWLQCRGIGESVGLTGLATWHHQKPYCDRLYYVQPPVWRYNTHQMSLQQYIPYINKYESTTPISSMHISKQDLSSYAYFTTLHVALQQTKYLLFTELINSYDTTLQVCITTFCVFITHTMKNNVIQLHQFNETYSLFLVPISFIRSPAFLKIFTVFSRSSIWSKDNHCSKVGDNLIHLVKQHILTIYEV